jgi:hypothetical protein
MVAVLLVVALTVPAAAADQTCEDDKMFDEIVILSVTPIESVLSWDASELLSYGDGAAGSYPTGQLEVQFNDINTSHKITHYDVIATPSGDPGTSKELGIDEVVTQVDRPSDVGSVVTANLDLEPGTNYDIDVVSYFYSVQTSPNQSNQDSLGATTFLSPPFLGGGVALKDMHLKRPGSPSNRGVHYLVYKADKEELHTLRWLNPEFFGPFDHKWKVSGDAKTDAKGADILCTDDDGDLVDDCYDGAKNVVGITHYRVTVTDDNGNTEYNENIEVDRDAAVYSATFNLNDGTYTFAVDAGYEDGGKFYALSDKAQVEFDIPDDYRKWNQDIEEVFALLNDIHGSVYEEEDDFDAFYDSDWNFEGYSGAGKHDSLTPGSDVPATLEVDDTAGNLAEVNTRNGEITAARATWQGPHQHALTIYLNNLYN